MKGCKIVKQKPVLIALIILAVIILAVGFYIGYRKYDFARMGKIYFLEYRLAPRTENPQTIIYEYCSEYEKPLAIATVDGWFHNAKIDENKEYIIGFKTSMFDVLTTPADIVRISLKDGTEEVYLSNEEIVSVLGSDFSSYDSIDSFIGENGETIFFGGSWVLYDLNSKESRELGEVLNEIGSKDINDLSNGALWIAGSDGYVVKYDIETEEITMIPSDVTSAFSVYDDANIAYAKDNKKHSPKYCMYQGEEGTVCVAKGGWNTYCAGSNNPYEFGWAENGDYLLYMMSFPGIMREETLGLKAYSVKTGWTYTFYRRFATGDRYEFVKYS